MDRTEVTITYRAGPAVKVCKKDGTEMITLDQRSNQMTLFIDEAASLLQVEAHTQRPPALSQSAAPAGMNGDPVPTIPELPTQPPIPDVPGSDVHAPLTSTASMGDTLD